MVNHMQHVHHHLHEARDNGVATAVQVVYVTAEPTFSGPIASYVTPSQAQVQAPPATQVSSMPAVVAAPSSSIDTAAIPTSINASSADASSAPSSAASSAAFSSASPSSQAASSTTQAPSSSLSNSPVQSTPAPTSANADSVSTSAAPSATPSSQGMSTGAQAGLAIGLLALAVIIITAAFFIYRARKTKAQKQAQKLDDEKSPFGGNQSMTTSSVAPRLSLGNGLSEKGGLMAPVPAVTRNSDNEKANPFGDHARLPEAKLPTLDDMNLAPKPLNVSRPGSPDKEQAAAGAGPRAGSPTQNANVHRVQLDFNPSMDDELELRQGQLVRMLHEYDDGWCLCIRLDRSQQGVVPRSCVSKNPVKPRPAPGPNGAPASPRMNGPPPAGRPVPSGNRARSNSSAPRPISPQQGPFGEGQYRVRSNTVDSKPASIVSAESLSGSPNHASPESGSPTLPPAKMAPGQAV